MKIMLNKMKHGEYSHTDLLKKYTVQIHVFNSYLLAYQRNTVAQQLHGLYI